MTGFRCLDSGTTAKYANNKAKKETAPSANCTQKLIGLTTWKVAANFCLVG